MTGSHDEQEDMSRWRRMHEYEASAEEARMQESISNCLYFELVIQMLEQGVKGEIDITGVKILTVVGKNDDISILGGLK